MSKARPLCIGLVVVLLQSACNEDRKDHDKKKKDIELAAKELSESKEESEKRDLLRDPGAFLETSDLVYHDKGIINDYRQLTGVTVLNRSKHAVRDVAGEVDWLNDKNEKLASMPFTLKGSIPAGDTKTFSKDAGTLSNGTVESSAKKARVRITSVRLVSP